VASPAPEPVRLAGAELLERAVGYTRGCLQAVARTDLCTPTPCRGWSLLDLLEHMDDSLAAFTGAAEVGYVALTPVAAGSGPGVQVVGRLQARACALLAAWAPIRATTGVAVADRALRSDVLAAAGALEIAVHGWDVARTCREHRPLPEALALELLDVLPLVVGPADRPGRFGRPHDVPVAVGVGTRLLAALGRPA